MATSENNIVPIHLYSSSMPKLGNGAKTGFKVQSPSEPNKIAMFSPAFYGACTVGGMLSCGLTHTAITPLDVVKCNLQIDPAKYKNTSTGFSVVLKEQGARGLFKGWAPTLLGYSVQGAFKYGLYEYFKKYYSDIAGADYAAKYKTLIYLAGSASAEVIADVALCPFEAVKVRLQTQPGFARGLSDGLPKIVRSEGLLGLYKGIGPLWARQIPYTMMKFASFENTVELLYKHIVTIPKDQCSTLQQAGVSFSGGYIAGVFCAMISHPADNLVSFLNNSKGATVSEVGDNPFMKSMVVFVTHSWKLCNKVFSCEVSSNDIRIVLQINFGNQVRGMNQAVQKMGLVGLCTRGLPLRILMVGTLTGAQWGIYDSFKMFVGLPTTGGVSQE